ncbi:F0F1-ATPase subunit [human gut metagenome]|uniref:F0F1-ATPase subunit n=1 Tax=human gut metagenome TaxID=408170 RepID=K1SB12_9ZZZZ
MLGVWLGNLTGINWLMIPFFFMGALAGFTNIYKTVRKLYRQEEKKENHVKKD